MASSAVTNGQESPAATEPNSNPSLPEDLVISCLACVSRLHYPSLSLVSKTFRSLLASPVLYQTRSLLNHIESCLYVCLQYPSDPIPRWFTLCNRNLSSKKKKKKKSYHALAPISFTNAAPLEWSDLVAVDHRLYAICEAATSSYVSFLDCTSHTWLQAPSLRLAHTGRIFDEKMYLPGSCEKLESLNCVEMFDIKTQTWKPIPPEKRKFKPGDMEGKIVLKTNSGRKGFSLKPKEMTSEWTGVERDSVCLIEDIFYSYTSSGDFQWSYCKEAYEQRKLEGLEGLPEFPPYSSVTLVDYGGKMVVFWDKYLPSSWFREKMIWCAVISFEKRGSDVIWGNVEWFDAVLKVPKSYKFMSAIAATV
ncbi:hypothetical protein AALP_AA3G037000 [Arabis alpina]|uniref:F-box domain-containing protein n=1 Tax=Arabis alpina TaxID=50452 RepID=A0A087H6U7_ARAAL|nr:hypothetical protein AALP_AA3G037000 [Arabis alpina]